MNNTRYADFLEIIGAPGRGKTTVLKNILQQKIDRGERAIIILPDTSEKAWWDYPVIYDDELEEKFDVNFEGVIAILYEENVVFPFLYEKFKHEGLQNLNLILDDPYYVEGRPENEMRRILQRKRQWGIDIFSTSHSYDQVPPIFFPYITMFGLSYTESEIVNRRQQLGADYSTHVNLRRQVNMACGTDKNSSKYFNFYFFDRQGNLK